MSRFDCQACGVCCQNTEANRERETDEYIEVTKDDELYRAHREVLRKLGRRNARGQWHLKLVGDEQRCIALEGEFEKGVGCTIYKMRPRGCRVVQAGDEECLRARRRFGLPLTRAADLERIDRIDPSD